MLHVKQVLRLGPVLQVLQVLLAWVWGASLSGAASCAGQGGGVFEALTWGA